MVDKPGRRAAKSSRKPSFNNWNKAFLSELAATSNVSAAAREAGITTAMAYDARRANPEFNRKWQQALCEDYGHLEMELLHRLRSGELKPAAGAKRGVRAFDNATAFRLLAAHRESAARQRAIRTTRIPRRFSNRSTPSWTRCVSAGLQPPTQPRTREPAMANNERLEELLRLETAERLEKLQGLRDEQRRELRYHWRLWARPEQLPPESDWRIWLILAGRGFGKTPAGTEWVRAVTGADPEARVAQRRGGDALFGARARSAARPPT